MAEIVFVYWTNATITVYDTATGELLASQSYTCTTIRYPDPGSVSCTPDS
jgi:hypothetical protein